METAQTQMVVSYATVTQAGKKKKMVITLGVCGWKIKVETALRI